MSKGSKQRPIQNKKSFDENWDKIFEKKAEPSYIDGHRPDSWSVLEVKVDGKTFHKIIVGFAGGYLHGDAWRMNSGISSIEETDKLYIVHGISESVYLLPKYGEGVRGYAAIVAADLLKQAKEQDKFTLKVVKMKDILSKYTHD